MDVNEVSTADLKKIFPHGVRIASGKKEISFPLSEVEILRHEDSAPIFFGWAYPNKDMYYPIESLDETEHGWTLKSEGDFYLLTALPENEGKNLSEEMRLV